MTGKRKWYSLVDKVWRMDNLEAAWMAVKANQGAAGVDGQTIDDFAANKEEELQRLQEELRTKTYGNVSAKDCADKHRFLAVRAENVKLLPRL